jgi:hypothetical protein
MRSYRKEELFEDYRPAVEELKLIIGELGNFEQENGEHGQIEKHRACGRANGDGAKTSARGKSRRKPRVERIQRSVRRAAATGFG